MDLRLNILHYCTLLSTNVNGNEYNEFTTKQLRLDIEMQQIFPKPN